ncbi:MAG: DUF4276 family protein [Roseateles asaccharophilus]|uniref:DUF4276 family protein n=1 Tax=Roseateles asaccharophilus TaxID=582607 RepID=UPI00391C42BD
MAGRIVFLLEEPSMKDLLEGLLPRLMPGWVAGEHFLCVKHEGKSDLDRSIPRKLSAWQFPGDRFIVVRDNDGADCAAVLAKLKGLCAAAGRPDTLVRLACQELEAWYLGDLSAVASAFDQVKADTPATRKRFAEPDSWQKPSVEMQRLVPSFQKRAGARAMAQYLREPEFNRSPSYGKFIDGVRRVAGEMATASASHV